MQTAYARDPGLWLANFFAIGVVVAVAVVDLAVRTHRRNEQTGVVAYVLGVLLCAYSLFGLLYGVAAIAPIGLMIIVSGIRMTRQRVAVTQTS
jgi:hypothetical protein